MLLIEVLERSVDEFFRSAFRGIWKGYCILYLIRGVLDGRYNEEAYDLLKIKHCDIVTGHQGRICSPRHLCEPPSIDDVQNQAKAED